MDSNYHHSQQAQPQLNNEQQIDGFKFIALSILAGAVIISATIFYNFNLLIKSGLQSQKTVIAGTNLNQGTQVPQAPTPAPTGPVTIASRAGQPTEGNSSAKVEVVEFADFQCPFCKSFFENTYTQIKSQYIDTGKVKMVFRHFPLSFHANAQISAVAAECANQQGKFWQYHDLLFKNSQSDGTNLDKASLEKYADQLGLNKGTLGFGKNKFNQCLQNNDTLKIVQADTAEGTKDGVTGTPTFYINGVQLVGAQPISAFVKAIDAALAK